ncbi:MAG: hypothetical protein M1454_04560 [Candidatus Thermoplasmatota archaeon]|nr:hypothetical protein [Candidatus Thermoplasmatota archaeon]
MTWIEGEAKRVIGFGVAGLFTYVYKQPVGLVNIQILREMAASAPQMVRFRIEWEGTGRKRHRFRMIDGTRKGREARQDPGRRYFIFLNVMLPFSS